MFSIVSLIVLALLAWFVFRMLKRNKTVGGSGRDPLEHDRDGLNQPLPGQRAATDGEVHDAARSHVGGHLETDRNGAVGAPAEGVAPGSPEPAAGGRPNGGATAEPLDASTAARAAEESRNTGGTGTAVLAGIATAAGSAATRDGETSVERADDAGGADGADRARGTDHADHADHHERPDHAEGVDAEKRTNAPDPETAGTLDVEASRAADEGRTGAASTVPGGAESSSNDTPTGERDPVRDDARTNAPIGDATADSAARDPMPDAVAADTAPAAASAPDGVVEPGDRANAPDPDTAGAGALRDRSSDDRSNVVAGTVSLGIGGATSVPGAVVLGDGETPTEHAARHGDGAALPSDAGRLAGGDAHTNVREMIKILNLRTSDASRLGISDEDFERLRHGGADEALVEDVGARLRRMIG